MPREIDPAVIAEKNKRATTVAPIFLYELDLDDGQTVYLCRNTQNVTVDGQLYQAFPIELGADSQSTENTIPRLTITVKNISGEFGELIDREDAFVGNLVRKRWVVASELDKPYDLFEYEILEADSTETEVRFTVGLPDLLESPFPERRIIPPCLAAYRDPDTCGWPEPENLPAGVVDIPDCSHTLTGPNGCLAHGAAYVAAGVQPIHPKRYYGFWTVPRRRQ